jgi:glucosamine-6-phosphate deaminase
MAARVEIHDDPEALGQSLAADVLAALRADGLAKHPVLLGCPGGRSLRPTYREIGVQAAREKLDLSRLVILMMDEYLVPGQGQLVSADPAAHFSCRRFALEQIRDTFNAGLAPARQVRPENVWLPDAADPEAYDRRIADAGGAALFLLASGASDGHVAFNPPGSPRNSRTRIVPLAESTRTDNLRTFPEFRSLEEVPTHGVSSGIATIADLSRRAILVLTGADKRMAADRVTAASSYDPAWPSTVIHECRGARIVLDRAAAGKIATG